MIQFTEFYDDIDFMIALFFNRLINDTDIYEIAKRLKNKTSHDFLDIIIANGANGNNRRLFYNYLNALGIKRTDSKRAIAAKVFYYILHDKIDFYTGIKFVYRKVSKYENTKEIVGDDIGIESLGIFWYIDDGDASDEKYIEPAVESVITGMKQYINDHLESFLINNTTLKNNEKTVINTEIEKKVKEKALAKGIEILTKSIEAENNWRELINENKKNNVKLNKYEDIYKLLIEYEWRGESPEDKSEMKFIFKKGNEFIYYYKQKIENEYKVINGKWAIIYKDEHPLLNLEFNNYKHMNCECNIFELEKVYIIIYDSILYYQRKIQTAHNESAEKLILKKK